MDAMLLVATSFVAGVVAHAVWQTHRGVSEIRKSHDQHKGDNSSEHAELVRNAAVSNCPDFCPR